MALRGFTREGQSTAPTRADALRELGRQNLLPPPPEVFKWLDSSDEEAAKEAFPWLKKAFADVGDNINNNDLDKEKVKKVIKHPVVEGHDFSARKDLSEGPQPYHKYFADLHPKLEREHVVRVLRDMRHKRDKASQAVVDEHFDTIVDAVVNHKAFVASFSEKDRKTMEETYTKHKKQEGSGGEKEKKEYRVFDVGPIYHNDEAAKKANAWVKKNKPGEGWVFHGNWESHTIDGRRTSVAGFTRKQQEKDSGNASVGSGVSGEEGEPAPLPQGVQFLQDVSHGGDGEDPPNPGDGNVAPSRGLGYARMARRAEKILLIIFDVVVLLLNSGFMTVSPTVREELRGALRVVVDLIVRSEESLKILQELIRDLNVERSAASMWALLRFLYEKGLMAALEEAVGHMGWWDYITLAGPALVAIGLAFASDGLSVLAQVGFAMLSAVQLWEDVEDFINDLNTMETFNPGFQPVDVPTPPFIPLQHIVPIVGALASDMMGIAGLFAAIVENAAILGAASNILFYIILHHIDEEGGGDGGDGGDGAPGGEGGGSGDGANGVGGNMAGFNNKNDNNNNKKNKKVRKVYPLLCIGTKHHYDKVTCVKTILDPKRGTYTYIFKNQTRHNLSGELRVNKDGYLEGELLNEKMCFKIKAQK